MTLRATLAVLVISASLGLPTWPGSSRAARAQDATATDAEPPRDDLTAAESDPVAAPAVEVELVDGSRIVADEIVDMKDDVLSVQSEAMGKTKIKWLQIETLVSRKAVRVVLDDGTFVEGALEKGPPEYLLVRTPSLLEPLRVWIRIVDSINPPSATRVRYRGFGSVGMSAADGNTQTRGVQLLAEFEAWSRSQRLSAAAAWNYQENSTTITARNTRGSLKYDYFFTDRWYGYVSGFLEEDSLSDLNLRSTLSAGPGVQFVRPGDRREEFLEGYRWLNDLDFRGEAGLSFVSEDFRAGMDNRYVSARWATWIDWRPWPGVSVFHRHEGFPSIEDPEDVYIRSQQGVRYNVWGGWSVAAQLDWDWDNTPSAGFERSDFTYIFSIGYAFEL